MTLRQADRHPQLIMSYFQVLPSMPLPQTRLPAMRRFENGRCANRSYNPRHAFACASCQGSSSTFGGINLLFSQNNWQVSGDKPSCYRHLSDTGNGLPCRVRGGRNQLSLHVPPNTSVLDEEQGTGLPSWIVPQSSPDNSFSDSSPAGRCKQRQDSTD